MSILEPSDGAAGLAAMLTRRFVLTRGLALTAGSTAAAAVPGLVPLHRAADIPVNSPITSVSVPTAVDSVAPAVSPMGRVLQMPFTLGVASGEPEPDGFVLWTRLAPEPLAPDGYGGMPQRDVEVQWQVAEDAAFRSIVRTGTATARRAWAHSVHVEVSGLPPAQEFFYRFRAAEHISPVGRTRTAPAPGSLAPLTYAMTACANYEHGWFTAYRHLADAGPDIVLALGDYLYEGAPGSYKSASGTVRFHVGGRATTLAGYRQRHAQYKTDPDLQAAHAVAPWVVAYDDHEVLNNWAGDIPAFASDRNRFARIRAAAMKAYYEHMPLRRASRPGAGRMQTYRRIAWGGLANFHVLDTRQYRDDQACSDGIKPDCADRWDPSRTLLGSRQEDWLALGMQRSTATWDVLAQQVMLSPNWLTNFSFRPGMGGRTGHNLDCWDGYPAARDRLLATVRTASVRNLVVLTGDWHTHWAAEILSSYLDLDSRPLGVELITTSIASDGDGYAQTPWGLDCLARQPYFRHFDQRRGFVLVEATAERMRADFRVVDYITRPGAPARSSGAYVVEAGMPRLMPD